MGTSEGANKRWAKPEYREKMKKHPWRGARDFGKNKFGDIPEGFEKR